jgi:hypothetical protein
VPRRAAAPHPVLSLVLAAGLMTTGVLAVTGCGSRVAGHPVDIRPSTADRKLISGYFAALNIAAARGSAAQERLFAATQHPDFRGAPCSLQGLTVIADPAYTTLHPDADWRPPLADTPPRGRVYVIAANVIVQHDAAVVGNQVGSLHVVVLDGTAYGFAPCPA